MTCIFCGSRAHDYRQCTIGYRSVARQVDAHVGKTELSGQAPNVFVGKFGYPKVRAGILSTAHDEEHDDPAAWARANMPIPEIVRRRTELVNSFTVADIKVGGIFTDLVRDVSLAKRSVDVEVSLAKPVVPRLTINEAAAPHGPNVALTGGRITENVPIDTRVDKAAAATDLNASDAITRLTKRGVDPYYLTKAFSMGNFGIPVERKLVPTRWSITAVDDIRGKESLVRIREYTVGDCVAYYGGHLGNYYLLLCFDAPWSYELFEQYLGEKGAQVWTDYEPYQGRHEYASSTAGGYYAARVGITDALDTQRRQRAVLAIRIITDEYTTPLGVWVCREAVRKALSATPITFADRGLMVQYAREFLKKAFGYDADNALKRSRLLKELFGQKRLSEY
jgi:hypothetical protein